MRDRQSSPLPPGEGQGEGCRRVECLHHLSQSPTPSPLPLSQGRGETEAIRRRNSVTNSRPAPGCLAECSSRAANHRAFRAWPPSSSATAKRQADHARPSNCEASNSLRMLWMATWLACPATAENPLSAATCRRAGRAAGAKARPLDPAVADRPDRPSDSPAGHRAATSGTDDFADRQATSGRCQ